MRLSKLPFFYERAPFSGYKEKGLGQPLFMEEEVWNEDIPKIIDEIKCEKSVAAIRSHFQKHQHTDRTVIVESLEPDFALDVKDPSLIILDDTLNHAPKLNQLLNHVNALLPQGGYLVCHCQTVFLRRQKLIHENLPVINYIIAGADYFWHKVMGRAELTRWFYKLMTNGGRNRAIHRVEMIGRLYRAGFEVMCEYVCGDELCIVATKAHEPITQEKPNTGHIIRLRRVGKNGRQIGVYKFRTMYAYSEYMQDYIYKQEGLCEGGKIAHDYRITRLGSFMRRTWLDELPMILNFLKGDMKLVGIRPLSAHYFSLYSKELQELRTKTKPGLFPPFYADMPKTLDEIQSSEMRYLKAYMQASFATDWRYFWKGVYNIIIKRKRSK